MTAPAEQQSPTYYRMNPALVARLVGLGVVALALLVLLATVLVAIADLSTAVLLAVVLVGAVALGGTAWWLRSRAYVLRCDETGYRVRLIRGAGAHEAGWRDVQDAVAASPRGLPCVVLRLRDGRTTTIPVGALAVDREAFVHELREHLQRGQGHRPLV
ncbi:hypothetical protein [Nocardioides sp. zg-DK7169]|uniref:hypothetical protein n=1 Tax=Nocardioides sp. zg-DK7169 TaxID=2736600 RepID=UPI001557B504|nr:hypothetical protein [Nocardioides sp. zg-DK7169]NPC98138.1 hypothetical protein [Nocardioides sp. zg-DK7169]